MENRKDVILLTEAEIKALATDGMVRVKTEVNEIEIKVMNTAKFR